MEHAIEVYHRIERMVWVGRSSKAAPLPWPGIPSTRAGCSEPHPAGLAPFQGWHPHHLWEPVSVPQNAPGGRVHRVNEILKAICSATEASLILVKIIQKKKPPKPD